MDDFTLRRALSDHLRELGDEDAADAIKWTAEKKFSPALLSEGKTYGLINSKLMPLPNRLYDLAPLVKSGHTPSDALNRIIHAWKASTPEERAEYQNHPESESNPTTYSRKLNEYLKSKISV